MNGYVSLGISILIGIGGQIALKTGSLRAASSGKAYAMFLELYVIGGLGLYFLAALFYIMALKKIPLSQAFPTVSISYVLVALLAHWLWGEPFGVRQVVSLSLIASGILLLYRG